MAHQSDSQAQREAELLILAWVSSQVGAELAKRKLPLEGGLVEIDGVDAEEAVLVEVFAHQGPLKRGQKHKVASDALRLITLARSRDGARMILAFASDEAAAWANGKSWFAEALRTWGVEVLVAELAAEVQANLLAAQSLQVMSNPPLEAPPAS